MDFQIVLSGDINELVSGNATPGNEWRSVETSAYRTMAVAKILKFTRHLILHFAAFTLAVYHRKSSKEKPWVSLFAVITKTLSHVALLAIVCS